MSSRWTVLVLIVPIILALWVKSAYFDIVRIYLPNVFHWESSHSQQETDSHMETEVLHSTHRWSLHRNGEAAACFTGDLDWNLDQDAFSAANKFQLDAFLTLHMAMRLPHDVCGEIKGSRSNESTSTPAFLHYCDRGVDRTPILPDHAQLVRVDTWNTLPCHFHLRNGLRITSLHQLHSDDRNATVDLYAVPAGRLFLFAPSYIGERFHLSHVTTTTTTTDGHSHDTPVVLTTLSLQPLLFDIHHFFHTDEAMRIIQRALAETSETHRIKRSTTTGNPRNDKRTSENGFDTQGHDAMLLKRRSFQILGFDEYYENMADGLQILRYNQSTAYFPHYDYIDDIPGHPHDYNSHGVGSNRFATILLYMTDMQLQDGGQTVFMKAGQERHPDDSQAELEDLRQSDISSFIPKNSWEEEMIRDCKSRLAILPKMGRAVLFYSQLPDGQLDLSSLHGACPVLHGEKWAANLWIWNAPRDGYLEAPRKHGRRLTSTI